MDGNFDHSFDIAGVSQIRDMAYDGTYFYGSPANISPAVGSFSGSAYDAITSGGPYLWLFSQTSGVILHQFDIATQTFTGTTHDCSDIPGYDAVTGIAGGAATYIADDKLILLVNIQQDPNLIAAYELASTQSGPTLTVTYDGNGATGGTVPVDENSPYFSGAAVTVLGNTGNLLRDGYVFGDWNTSADGTGTDYTADDSFSMPEQNVVLYAQWTVEEEIPTVSEWGMIILSLLLAGLTLRQIRRRKRSLL